MQKEKGFKNHTIAFMISVAVFFDTFQWLMAFVFMDWLVGFFAFLTFYVWFKLHGMSFMSAKRAGTMSSAFIIEIIPFLSALPAWTLAVTILTLDSKIKKIVLGKKDDVTDENRNNKKSRSGEKKEAA